MRKISAFLALVALCLGEAVFANGVVTTANGNVQVIRGATPVRVLRQGDEVNQGDTVVTGPASAVVMKFDDGQIAALTANSRMTITAYQYNPEPQSGNVLLSLINGGMRTITGVIGKLTPHRVSYRVASATIGIRGTEVLSATDGREVVAIVLADSITVTVNGQTYTVVAGEGIHVRPDGTVRIAPAQEILRGVGPGFGEFIAGLQALTDAIIRAGPGLPRSGITGPDLGTPNTIINPTGGAGGGGTPTGPASPS